MRNIGAVLFLLTAALPQGQLAHANMVHVEIGGLRNDKGQVFCALYSSRDGFPKNTEKAVARIKSAISDKQAVCEFSGMAPGTYAVSVFHDENSNGKLDTNFMGIPAKAWEHRMARKVISDHLNLTPRPFIFRVGGST